MLPNPRKITLKFKKPESGFPDSSFLGDGEPQLQQFVDISSSSSASSSDNDSLNSDDENSQSKAVVLYNPETTDGGAIVTVPGPLAPRRIPFRPSQPLPAVGAFTVQCAECFKWRLIPTKEKYEAIREHILERPFYCTTAREWRPDISCEEPADISQDGSRLWAIDKPNIAQPPPGWQRLLRIRGEGSTKFADVYYVAPSGKRLRSMVEIQKYLFQHPELTSEGLSLSQFSFRTPKPLQENYVRKRPRLLAPCDGTGNRPLETDAEQIQPLAWAGPDGSTDLQLGMSVLPPPTICEPTQPAKRQATETSSATDQDILDKKLEIDPKINTESS